VFRKKTPSHVFFYIFVEISQNFQGMLNRKQSFHTWKSYIFFATGDVMLKWWNVKTHQLVIMPTEPKNIIIHHTVFYCDLFSWFIFWLSARSSTLLMLAGVCTLCHCMDDNLSAISRTAWNCWSCQFLYLNISFHQYSIVCVLSRNILHKLAAL